MRYILRGLITFASNMIFAPLASAQDEANFRDRNARSAGHKRIGPILFLDEIKGASGCQIHR